MYVSWVLVHGVMSGSKVMAFGARKYEVRVVLVRFV